jgi:hypothetical protein
MEGAVQLSPVGLDVANFRRNIRRYNGFLVIMSGLWGGFPGVRQQIEREQTTVLVFSKAGPNLEMTKDFPALIHLFTPGHLHSWMSKAS